MHKSDSIKKRTKLEMKEGKRSARATDRKLKRWMAEHDALYEARKSDPETNQSTAVGLPPTGDIQFPEAVQKQVDAANKFFVHDYAGVIDGIQVYIDQLRENMLRDYDDRARGRYEVGYALLTHLKQFTF